MTDFYVPGRHYEWNRNIYKSSENGLPVENSRTKGISVFVDNAPYSRISYAYARDIPWQHITMDARLVNKKITFVVNNATTPIPEDLKEFYVVKPKELVKPVIPVKNNDVKPISPNTLSMKSDLTEIMENFIPSKKPSKSEKSQLLKNGPRYSSKKEKYLQADFEYPWNYELYEVFGNNNPLENENFSGYLEFSYKNGKFIPFKDIESSRKDKWEYLANLATANNRVTFRTKHKDLIKFNSVAESYYYTINNFRTYGTKNVRYAIPNVHYIWDETIRDLCIKESKKYGDEHILVTLPGQHRSAHICVYGDGKVLCNIVNDPNDKKDKSVLSWEDLNVYLNRGIKLTFTTHNSSVVWRNYVMPFYADVYGMPKTVASTLPEKLRRTNCNTLNSNKKVEKVKETFVNKPSKIVEAKEALEMKKDVIGIVSNSLEARLKELAPVAAPKRFAYQPNVTYIWSHSAASLSKTPFVNELPSNNRLTVNKFMMDQQTGKRVTSLVNKCDTWNQVATNNKQHLMYHFSVSESNIEIPSILIKHFEDNYGFSFDEITEPEADYFFSPKEEYLWTPELAEQIGDIGPFARKPYFGLVTVFFHTSNNVTFEAKTALIDWKNIPKDVMVTFKVTTDIHMEKELEHILVPAFNESNLIKVF